LEAWTLRIHTAAAATGTPEGGFDVFATTNQGQGFQAQLVLSSQPTNEGKTFKLQMLLLIVCASFSLGVACL